MKKHILKLFNEAGFHQPEMERQNLVGKFEKFAELLEKELEAKHFSEGYLQGQSDGIKDTARGCAQFVEDKFDFCGDEILIAERIREHYGIKIMTVYTAHVVTESADHYVWVYATEPTRDQVIQRLYEHEHAADIDWYEATTKVHIESTEVIE